MTQNNNTIAIAFGSIMTVLAIIGIIIAWKYRNRQHTFQPPNLTFTVKPLASSPTPPHDIGSRTMPK